RVARRADGCRRGLVARPLRAFLLLDHAAAVAAALGVPAVAGAVIDVRRAAQVARPPRRPEQQVGEEADQADDDQDPAYGVDVDRARMRRVDGEGKDEADSNDDEAD